MLLRFRGMVLGVILALGAMEPSAQSRALKAVMREKLNNTQQLLEAVITADYAAMERYTDRLGRISYTEIASWQAVAQPDYVGQAVRFLESVKGVREAAGQKNIEAATQEYSNMISTCMRCHSYVRKARIVSLVPREPLFRAVPDATTAAMKAPVVGGFYEDDK
jgi:hypothetical protein